MREFIEQILSTFITVAIAVGLCGALWVLANQFVNRLRDTSSRATYFARALAGFLVAGLLSGNRLTQYSTAASGDSFVQSFAQWVWLPTATAFAVGISSWVAEQQSRLAQRVIVNVLFIGTVGGLLGALLVDAAQPKPIIDELALSAAISSVLFAAIGGSNTPIDTQPRGGSSRAIGHQCGSAARCLGVRRPRIDVEIFGHCIVCRHWLSHRHALGFWVTNQQRATYRHRASRTRRSVPGSCAWVRCHRIGDSITKNHLFVTARSESEDIRWNRQLHLDLSRSKSLGHVTYRITMDESPHDGSRSVLFLIRFTGHSQSSSFGTLRGVR